MPIEMAGRLDRPLGSRQCSNETKVNDWKLYWRSQINDLLYGVLHVPVPFVLNINSFKHYCGNNWLYILEFSLVQVMFDPNIAWYYYDGYFNIYLSIYLSLSLSLYIYIYIYIYHGDGPIGPSPRPTNSLTHRVNHANRLTHVPAQDRGRLAHSHPHALVTERISSMSHPRTRRSPHASA
jgi:hypothetical protein